MTKKVFLVLLLFFSFKTFGWGIIGHRTVGQIAEDHLSRRVNKKISKLLDGESLAVASTWMDEVRSDSLYDYAETWHWVSIPTGMTYEESEKNDDGDVIEAIERLTKKLKAGNLKKKEEAEALKMLIHLVGDIHQPLHVGTGEDMGGNMVRLKWFWSNSNLHRVWDKGMIDSQKYSYTELANSIHINPSKDQIEQWQSSTVRDWAYESMALRDQVYDLPEDMDLKYEYRYKNWETVELRILQAGIRLAGLLDEIYG